MSDSNKQIIFDAVVRHLLTQNRRAVDSFCTDGVIRCRYRTKNGLKCAIGGLIKDEFYRTAFEGNSVNALPISKAVEKSLHIKINTEDLAFLRGLQAIHDGFLPERWCEKLRETANDNTLTMPAEFIDNTCPE